MRKEIKFEVNHMNIKVPFDELLYDIIFVIVISKVTEILFSSGELSWQVIVSSLIIFGSLVWVWLFRVNQLNNIHILQYKLNDFSLKSEKLTYFEIVGLVTILFSVHHLSYQYILLIMGLAIAATHFSFTRIRNRIITNAETHDKFHQIHGYERPANFAKTINVEYVFERLGVVFVLFMGEILSAAFNQVEHLSNFFIIAVIVVSMFNNNIKILKTSSEYLEHNNDPRVYRFTIECAKSLLTLLLAILVCIEAIDHFAFSSILIITVMIIYFLAEHRMKKALAVKSLNISLFVNVAAVLLLVLNLPINSIFKFIFGFIIFGINMYFAD